MPGILLKYHFGLIENWGFKPDWIVLLGCFVDLLFQVYMTLFAPTRISTVSRDRLDHWYWMTPKYKHTKISSHAHFSSYFFVLGWACIAWDNTFMPECQTEIVLTVRINWILRDNVFTRQIKSWSCFAKILCSNSFFCL